MLLAEYAGRRAGGFESIVELAELTGAAVWDVNNALNFPNKHPLCLSMDKESLRRTDLVVGLDVNDWEKQLTELNSAKRTREQITPPSCDFVEIGFGEINISKWAMDYCRMQPCSIRALGDTALGIPELTRICRKRIAGDTKLQAHQGTQRRDRQAARRSLGEVAGRGAQELGRLADHLLTAGARGLGGDQGRGLGAHRQQPQAAGAQAVDFDKPYRHPGVELGTSTQIGISLGVALAHKGTGRVVVDIQPDGDLMFDAGALWVAAKYQIPMLVVMHNNRAYYNDWEHQIRMARLRGTDEAKAHIGMDLFGPEPDFGALARHGLLGRRPDRQAAGRAAGAPARARRGEEGGWRWWTRSRSTGRARWAKARKERPAGHRRQGEFRSGPAASRPSDRHLQVLGGPERHLPAGLDLDRLAGRGIARPMRAARLRTCRMPRPEILMRSPFLRCLVISPTRSPSRASPARLVI